METIVSARVVAEGKDTPETIEVTTEKVITETRTYSRRFLLDQRAEIVKSMESYIADREAELAKVDELLKRFGE